MWSAPCSCVNFSGFSQGKNETPFLYFALWMMKKNRAVGCSLKMYEWFQALYVRLQNQRELRNKSIHHLHVKILVKIYKSYMEKSILSPFFLFSGDRLTEWISFCWWIYSLNKCVPISYKKLSSTLTIQESFGFRWTYSTG